MALRIRCPMCNMLVWLKSFSKGITPKLFKQRMIAKGKKHSTFLYDDITTANYEQIKQLYLQKAYQIIEFFEAEKTALTFEFGIKPAIEMITQPTFELRTIPTIRLS